MRVPNDGALGLRGGSSYQQSQPLDRLVQLGQEDAVAITQQYAYRSSYATASRSCCRLLRRAPAYATIDSGARLFQKFPLLLMYDQRIQSSDWELWKMHQDMAQDPKHGYGLNARTVQTVLAPWLAFALLALAGCASSSRTLGLSIAECQQSVPSEYRYVGLSADDKAVLMANIRSYLVRIDDEERMRDREYWLFEASSGDALVCEVSRDTRRYRSCSPDMWKLPNRSREIDAPAIEGVCIVG